MYVSLLLRVVLLPVIIMVEPCAMAQPAPSGQPPVGVITVERRPMTESFEFNGRIQAINSVNIVARVTVFVETQPYVQGSDGNNDYTRNGPAQPAFLAHDGVQHAAVEQ